MKHNIPQLTKQLTETHFPDLAGVRITFEETRGKRFFCAIHRELFGSYVLSYTKSVNELQEFELVAVLAHELAHILQTIKRGYINYRLADEVEIEREADTIVINRGLGENLHAFLKYHDSHYRKYNKKDGLTKKEVKGMIKGG